VTIETRQLEDRAAAGRLLAECLRKYAGRDDVIVLGLPRGGVPVAYEIARALDAPMDVFLVRKLGVPGHEELAFGAIASGGTRVLNMPVVESLDFPDDLIEAVTEEEKRELERRERLYRGDRPPPRLAGRTVILVDDGLATGSTMWAAVRAARQDRPARVVAAVPVADPDVCAGLRAEADEVACLFTPQPLHAVGVWYEDFSQTSDEEVRELLARARRPELPRRPEGMRVLTDTPADYDPLVSLARRPGIRTTVKHDELIGQVQARARLPSRGDAERATRVVLETLGARLAGGQPENLAAQLPEEIGRHLTAHEPVEKLSLDDFFAQVSEGLGADRPDAVHQARAVIAVVSDAVSAGEIEKVRQQLPGEYAPLFESGSEGEMQRQAS
jgi:predicted phosphoribosyltransferase/uncharacterized protein (DUF2267 family)